MKLSRLTHELDVQGMDALAAYGSLRAQDTYFLESAEGGEKVARYSFIGVDPMLKLTFAEGKPNLQAFDGGVGDAIAEGADPLSCLQNLMNSFETKPEDFARFIGGFVGYFSYDIIRYIEKLGESPKDDLGQPDCELILAKNNLIFDHVAKKIFLTSNFLEGSESAAEDEVARLEAHLKDLDSTASSPKLTLGGDVDFTSNMTQAEYEAAVRASVEYIKAGDVFQVVPSQRLSADYSGEHLDVYRILKEINPSPYMFFLDYGDRKIVGSSPEMLARVEGDVVTTYPIAGTRGRGKTSAEDKKLEEEMLASEKERAEHVMLVDLGRNDLGRVSEFGSVKVDKFMGVEKYSHVQHIVSEVTGKLRKDKNAFDALASIFPAGTVSGAPKVRAMEIIDELEPTRRGVYAGAVGYFSFNGNMDTAITIRTLVFEKSKAFVQAGAGVVADSVPEHEYKETLKKARALVNALGVQ